MALTRRGWSALAATAALALAACGGDGDGDDEQSSAPQETADEADGNDTDENEADEAEAAEPVELEMWTWVVNMQPVVDAWNAEHPDIQVTLTETPSGNNGGYSQLTNALTAGNAPDIATIEYPQLPEYVSQGAVQPLSDGMVTELGGEMPEQITNLATFGGDMYGAPYDAPPLVFYYRKSFFDEHGIDAPTTWEEFRTAAEEVKAADSDVRISSFFPNEAFILAALSWQNGGQWFGIDGDSWKVGITDEPTAEVAEFWQGLIDDDLVAVQQAWSNEWAADLAEGRVIGYIGASWSAQSLKSRTEGQDGEWAVMEVPTWDGESATGLYGGSTFTLTKDSEHADAASEFITWLVTSEESMKARGDVGATYPAAESLVDIPKAAYDTSLFDGQDIYEVFDAAYASVVDGWVWGPAASATFTTLQDDLAGGDVMEALQSAEDATIARMNDVGLSVEQ